MTFFFIVSGAINLKKSFTESLGDSPGIACFKYCKHEPHTYFRCVGWMCNFYLCGEPYGDTRTIRLNRASHYFTTKKRTQKPKLKNKIDNSSLQSWITDLKHICYNRRSVLLQKAKCPSCGLDLIPFLLFNLYNFTFSLYHRLLSPWWNISIRLKMPFWKKVLPALCFQLSTQFSVLFL